MPLLPMSRSRMKKGLNGIKINFKLALFFKKIEQVYFNVLKLKEINYRLI